MILLVKSSTATMMIIFIVLDGIVGARLTTQGYVASDNFNGTSCPCDSI